MTSSAKIAILPYCDSSLEYAMTPRKAGQRVGDLRSLFLFCIVSKTVFYTPPSCGVAEKTGLGFVCFVFFNPVASQQSCFFFFFFFFFYIFQFTPPPPSSFPTLSWPVCATITNFGKRVTPFPYLSTQNPPNYTPSKLLFLTSKRLLAAPPCSLFLYF